jgi:ATP-dependent exoDNAse (exonuclease V) alpha subunit
MQKLAELPGKSRVSRMEVMLPDTVGLYEEPREPTSQELGRARFASVLSLKDDARVMLLTNDSLDRWVNGSTGIVSSIEVGAVWVRLDSGEEVEVTKTDEEILDGDGNVICTIRQYPIQLAWATTIHKSQGSTIDRVGIDLNGHFETGQTYVAMSRCRTADGLFLVGTLRGLLVDEYALSICT